MWSNRRGEKIVRRTIDGSDPGAPAVQRMFAEAESAARRLTFAARQQRADQDVSARSEQIETSGGTVDARFVTNNGQETLILTAYPKGAKSPGGGGRVRVQKIFEVDRSLIEGDVPQEAIDAAARSIFKEIVTSLVMLPPEHLVMVGGIAAMALAGFAIYAILKIVSLSKEKR